MFSAALEWLGQEHRIDPAVLTNRVLIQLNDGDNVIGRNSLALADPKYDGLHRVSWAVFNGSILSAGFQGPRLRFTLIQVLAL